LNQATAAGLDTSMALTGDAFHQRKKPGFMNQGGRASDSTKKPAALPSA
jgi:hypothetical protein